MTTDTGTVRLIDAFERALLSLDRVEALRILTASNMKLPMEQMIEQVVAPALERMGARWEAGDVALSQIYMGGRICEELVDQLLPPESPERKRQPPMAIAVLEDYHLLGKRIVYSTLRANGFELQDWGRQDVEGVLLRVQQDRIEILLLSALMLPSALRVKDVKAGLASMGWPVRLIVGGAPFRLDDALWKEVGADATSANAEGAVAIINEFIEGCSA